MLQRCPQVFHATVDNDALRVPVLNVRRGCAAIEHGDGWINAAVKSSSVNTVRKPGAIARRSFVGPQSLQFSQRFVRDYIIRIKRQHPRGRDSRLAQAKLPLIAVTIKLALKDAHVGKRRRNLERFVVAETIHNDDILRPAKPLKRAPDVRRFVIREYQRRAIIEHYVSERNS